MKRLWSVTDQPCEVAKAGNRFAILSRRSSAAFLASPSRKAYCPLAFEHVGRLSRPVVSHAVGLEDLAYAAGNYAVERGPARHEVDCGDQGVLDQEAVTLLDAVDDGHNFGELAGGGQQRIDGFRRRYRPRYQLVGLVFPDDVLRTYDSFRHIG